MRPIKFRVFYEGKMIYPKQFLCDEGEIKACFYSDNEVPQIKGPNNENGYEIMQFTGREDLNGEELYDGDIVEVFGIIAEIQWSDLWSGWIFYCHFKPEGLRDLPFSNGEVSNCHSAIKKGNKFENPELLTK